MKTTILSIIILLLLARMQAQVTAPAYKPLEHSHDHDTTCSKNMAKATAYLKGYNHPYEPEKAFALFMQCAQAGTPAAMNAVAILYRSGTGIETNYQQAMKWFEKAGELGYPKSWYNLGFMYKNGEGTPQDFVKAYQCFSKASELGYAGGYYYQGYMLYKGLGCEQDYTHASELFKKGAAEGRSSCMYMLGLCLRNGYGVTRDTASARTWLEEANKQGHPFSGDELASSEPENIPQKPVLKSAHKADAQTPSTFKRVKHRVPNHNITGNYTGYLITYDWSGQTVLSKTTLKVNINASGNHVTGQWLEVGSPNATFEGNLTDTTLCFTGSMYRRTEHYTRHKPLQWEFKNASIDVVKGDTTVYLAGNVQFHLTEWNEPAKPMYISLTKTSEPVCTCDSGCTCGGSCKCSTAPKNTKSGKLETKPEAQTRSVLTHILAYPNPFSHDLTISFALQTDSEVKVKIYNMGGNLVAERSPGILPVGKQEVSLALTVPAGIYMVKVFCNGDVATTIVVKQ